MENESQRHRLERCQQDVEEHPERASAHHNLGLAYTVSGRVKQAEKAYLRALELDPTLIRAWVNLGGVRLMRWEFKGCLEANQEAAKLRDDIPNIHYNMGQAYLYLNDPENLVRCNERVIELDKDNGAAHYHAAVGHLTSHRARPPADTGFHEGFREGPEEESTATERDTDRDQRGGDPEKEKGGLRWPNSS